MEESRSAKRSTRGNMRDALPNTIDVWNAQTIIIARQNAPIAIGTWNAKNAWLMHTARAVNHA